VERWERTGPSARWNVEIDTSNWIHDARNQLCKIGRLAVAGARRADASSFHRLLVVASRHGSICAL
jgi:hypothetical protein